jgi:hypothetical protein
MTNNLKEFKVETLNINVFLKVIFSTATLSEQGEKRAKKF